MVNTIIAIIGVGGIGSRHFQALANLSIDADIYAVDLNHDALERTKKLFLENNPSDQIKTHFVNSLSYLPEEIDVLIIATSASVRLQILKEITQRSEVKHLVLEKVLFQAIEEYEEATKIIKEHQIDTYVNCTRRMWETYQEIHSEIKGEKVNIDIVGSHLDIGCNGIHFIDLFYYLANSEIMSIQSNLLKPEIIEGNRPETIDFVGKLIVSDNNFNTLTLKSFHEGDIPLSITITTPSKSYFIIESQNTMITTNSQKNLNLEAQNFKYSYQSGLTDKVVMKLINGDKLSLPTFEESKYIHIEFLKSLFRYFERNGYQYDKVPIT